MSAVHPPPTARRAPIGRWLVLGLLAFLALAVVATTLVLLGLLDGAREGLTFVVDGHPWRLGTDGTWDIDQHTVLGAVIGGLVIVTVLATVLPLVLLAVLLTVGGALLAAVLAVAASLAVVLLILALVLSPLWGLVLLLWLILRKPRAPKPVVAAD